MASLEPPQQDIGGTSAPQKDSTYSSSPADDFLVQVGAVAELRPTLGFLLLTVRREEALAHQRDSKSASMP